MKGFVDSLSGHCDDGGQVDDDAHDGHAEANRTVYEELDPEIGRVVFISDIMFCFRNGIVIS